MTRPREDEVALKLIHTADWHLGLRFPSFDRPDQPKLTRARLEVIDAILGEAERNRVDAVLCAGDLFDDPSPDDKWWKGLAEKLCARSWVDRPVFLLPGNHDPLTPSSVYSEQHPFRRSLPSWVHVVDRDGFSYELSDEAVLYAAPCRSHSDGKDPTLSLPAREPGDERIRIGLVHGQTFDIPGCQTNFPIAKDAAARCGLDYLAIGDTHSFRQVPAESAAPVVYPGAPEPTKFGETEAGYVALVFFPRSRRRPPRIERKRVAQWQWESLTCRSLTDLEELRDRDDLRSYVVRLRVEAQLPAPQYEQAKAILDELKGTDATCGKIGVVDLDDTALDLDIAAIDAAFDDAPDVLKAAAERLKQLDGPEQGAVAKRALYHLYRLCREATR